MLEWNAFQNHRTIIMDQISSIASRSQKTGRVCIIGAGHMNDIDLKQLKQLYDHVDLLDIDDAAMKEGLSFQTELNRPEVHMGTTFTTYTADTLSHAHTTCTHPPQHDY